MEQIKDLIGQIKLYVQLDLAFCEALEKLESRVYKLEQDNKRMLATVRELERRTAEMQIVLKSIN